MPEDEKDLIQTFEDWTEKSPDVMALRWLKNKLSELEEWKKGEEEQHQNIAEALDNFVIDAGAIADSVYSDKLKELEKKYKDLEERYRESGGLKCVRDRGLIKERIEKIEQVLQDHLKSHIVVAREQLTDKDKLTIFREFDEAIQKQLEKLDSHIKVTISRNDGEKGENSKDVISSKENNLSAPERRIDGGNSVPNGETVSLEKPPMDERGKPHCSLQNSTPSETLVLDPFGMDYIKKDGDSKEIECSICKGGFEWDDGEIDCDKRCQKDGEKEVEEMSNKNLCREESNIDILPPSKPSTLCTLKEQEKCASYKSILCLSSKITTCMFGNTKLEEKEPTSLKCEKCGFLISNINKYGAFYCWELDMKMFDLPLECLHFQLKELTEKEDHEFDYDYNCVKCGKNLLELMDRTYLTIEFDTHDTHKIVLNADLEKWYYLLKDKIFPKIGILEKGNILDGIKKYLEEKDECSL